ncbi:AAA family ATPase [Kitasatospora sp. NPDC001664]
MPEEPLTAAAGLLRSAGCLVVQGPWGSGKSTLLAALVAGADRPVLRLAPQPGDERRPFGTLTALAGQLPPTAAADLPAALRPVALPDRVGTLHPAAVPDPSSAPATSAAVHPSAADPAGPAEREAVRLALHAATAARPVLLVVDDAQWLDPATAAVLAHARRALAPGRLSVLAAVRGAAVPVPVRQLCGDHAPRLTPAPLTVPQLADLLGAAGLPRRWAGPVHRCSGGNPALVRASLAAAGPARADGPALPGSVGDAASREAERWLGTVPAPVREVLLTAALSEHPTLTLLGRLTGPAASAARLREAEDAGLVGIAPDGAVAFAADALRAAARGGRAVGPAAVPAAHLALAAAETDPVHAVRHRLLGQDPRDPRAPHAAADAEHAAALARRDGERALAAELLLLAADRVPPADRTARSRCLALAAADAAAAGRPDLAARVAGAVRAARLGPSEQVAALLAVIDTRGQALHESDALIARARHLAGDDPVLLAAVHLRDAVRANIGHGRPHRAVRAAALAADLARSGGDRVLEAAALTMRARMERVLGDPASARSLERARGLGVPVSRLGVRGSPDYLTARHAVFDDRLDRARAVLLDLLPAAEAGGDAEDVQEVLRSLAEVECRSGHCARALEWAGRALRHRSVTGLSAGPVSYTAALAETAGGAFARAAEHAALGLRVAREEHDLVFTSRNLLALGTVRLATGRLREAAAALEEVAALEAGQQVGDPTVLRWQPELAEAWAGLGRAREAHALLVSTRAALGRGAPGTGAEAACLRAAAAVSSQLGEADRARGQLRTAAELFAALGLRLEHGRTLLALGGLERAHRRRAAAREVWDEAAELFARCGAAPWTALLDALAGRSGPTAPGGPARSPLPTAGLTGAEDRLAALVADGLTNRETAERLHLSVKTVEAVLSRVYRKLGVRSRTELALALRRPVPERRGRGH